jgi:hypothetical protein
MSLGGGKVATGKGTISPPMSASEIWMRHYVINDCPHCWVGDTAEQSYFCAKGQRLREAALAEFRAIPPPPKKRPADTSFNPSIESRGR